MLKNFFILISIIFLSKNQKIDFSQKGQEFNAISYYFTDLFDNLQLDRESTVYLVYEKKKLSENETNLQYLFYLDLGEEKKFYVGIESESDDSNNFVINDYVSSTNLSKVLNFLKIDVEEVFQNPININYAKNLLTSELKPKFCNLEHYKTLTQNPLVKKQQFFFDFKTLGISKNQNYQSDKQKPHQVFINLPDNLTAHSIQIVRTNINKKKSALEQTNKNILTNSEKKEIINLVQKEEPKNKINLSNFDLELESILKGIENRGNNKSSDSSNENGNDVLVKKGNLYNNVVSDQQESNGRNFPRFELESINHIKHPSYSVEVDQEKKFPSEQDFEDFKKSIEKYGNKLSEFKGVEGNGQENADENIVEQNINEENIVDQNINNEDDFDQNIVEQNINDQNDFDQNIVEQNIAEMN